MFRNKEVYNILKKYICIYKNDLQPYVIKIYEIIILEIKNNQVSKTASKEF